MSPLLSTTNTHTHTHTYIHTHTHTHTHMHTHTHTQKYEETWNDAKKVLGNSQLLSLLKNYPKDNLTEKQVKKVNKHFTEDVTLEKMLLISKAGHGLLTWVVAIIKVSTVRTVSTYVRDVLSIFLSFYFVESYFYHCTDITCNSMTLNKLVSLFAHL